MKKKTIQRDANISLPCQKKSAPYISVKRIAEALGLNFRNMVYAIVEISDGDDGVEVIPAIAISGTEKYVNLLTASVSTIAPVNGCKSYLFRAFVFFDKESGNFIFKTRDGLKAAIHSKTLFSFFGDAVFGYSI